MSSPAAAPPASWTTSSPRSRTGSASRSPTRCRRASTRARSPRRPRSRPPPGSSARAIRRPWPPRSSSCSRACTCHASSTRTSGAAGCGTGASVRSRYSRWDGSQDLPDLDADDLLDEVADDILSHGDFQSALRRLLQQGLRPPEGRPTPGLRDLLERLRRKRQERLKFEELLASLRAQMLRPFLQGLQQSLRSLTPDDLRRMREMLQDLNRLLRERAEGGEPDFDAFREQWGELDAMMRALFLRDERLEAAMSQLAMSLAELLDPDELGQRYPFRGDEEVTLEEAMRLMDELAQMDRLEQALRGVRRVEDLEGIRPEDMERLVGPEARQDLERLQELTRTLEEAGYLERHGDELTLTARAIRKLADKALRDVFDRLKRDRFGGHPTERRGAGGDQTDETRAYEFGDPFLLDMKQTLLNAVERQGPGTPVRLAPGDFEVFRTENRSQAATVVMLDMSRSMLNNGYFLPAKKVALALSALIRSQFPRDALYVVGFSLYAREFTPQQLPTLSWSEWNVGTNMHAGFMLARRLLARHTGGNRQIVMVTDGEPTAHMEGDEADFAYPPTRRTVEETLREVRRCTRAGITINTFMLEQSPWLVSFVEQMAPINGGRAFLSAPDRLGEYVLVDYVRARRGRTA